MAELIDWKVLRDNCAGDDGLVAEVIGLFQTDAPAMVDDLKAAVESQDALRVRKTAHRIKGAFLSLAAAAASAHAKQLEEMGSKNNLAGAGEQFAKLETEMAALTKELDAWMAEHAA